MTSPWFLVLALILLYGFWAVAMRVVGQHVPISWAALIGLVVCLPVDIFLSSKLTWPPPKARYIVWTFALSLASIAASFIYLKAARHFSGVILTSFGSLYPLVALPVFLAMGERSSIKQGIGVLFCAAGVWLIS